ncbi:MAG: hypothetical protein A2268_04100 [Candidatus Raymondbacteria bacterium RifOxyA12_full_50_37]|uniref:DUF4019 domain-containing protein n=1 Tax=Candidatus Raymondbacteria bacterium RIFOXYD12_FULL_49_13 TaxID=1817890 RepID=A0A1F7FAY8_UNCRA|nr:MAG: hypothetical protein A2268_04100 [Candidatus Raymondbacteria bacterium RifOxyA12_full_50_37]OGJ92655.1 MAG: hypothetical protein A2248_05850 [Candidatus Raymondbacteria bacterium RIFOXYA2_FULL_49_16]OGJ92718.1 MAG: hypothetical protein A2350_16720 [Candidatus Raymondbacteria bacterium RifOxyB12_full_50_8]OGJ98009.1 MAG: hypothetical protein A2453_02875 [Candidatus Raymondbacteria bacterium RIFOXYC2_FULL_50_21]OGK02055.1 MAG: hypothetical protein A2487_01280 [Candidatus Raymondbacteria b
MLLLPPIIGCGKEKSNPQADDSAIQSAQTIVTAIDKEDYAGSYNAAAPYFKTALGSDEKWAEMLTAVRKPLGTCVSRELVSSKTMDKAPGAPDGRYAQIEFKASFENKKEAVETVVVLKEDDTWKLVGYFIK